MSNNIAVIGLQWGDEGKGKIIDYLSTSNIHTVARFHGGNNAGHTIIINNTKTVLKLIPSGILHKHIRCIIGHGVVVSIPDLFAEIDTLEQEHDDICSRLFISSACPIILPYHIKLDMAREAKQHNKIGTTCRGIGPAYEDQVARRAIHMYDLFNEKQLIEKIHVNLKYYTHLLSYYEYINDLQVNDIVDNLLQYRDRLLPMITDVSQLIYNSKDGILFEGAQGTMLDINIGTYPYVTSSSCLTGNIAAGLACSPKSIHSILGIVKAYTTRVGEGPMPTEQSNEIGQHLSTVGVEFGSNTGRARRCGWLDMVMLKKAIMANGVNELCITKLDVLDKLSDIKICTAYKLNGELLYTPPYDTSLLNQCETIYQTLPGWSTTTFGINDIARLPSQAKSYLKTIEDILEVPIKIVSTGPDRNHTIRL